MFKLNRFSRFPEPNLHKSVLICNTLRHIERELESEGISMASLIHSHNLGSHLGMPPHVGSQQSGIPQCPESVPSNTPPHPPTEGTLPSMHSPIVGTAMSLPPPHPSPSVVLAPMSPPHPVQYNNSSSNGSSSMQYSNNEYLTGSDHATNYAGGVRDNSHIVRPYSSEASQNLEDEAMSTEQSSESPSDMEDSIEDCPPVQKPSPLSPSDDRTEGINWCSVLSLSSQTDLDSMNNNEYSEWTGSSHPQSLELDYSSREETPAWKLPSLSVDDVLKSFPEAPKRPESNEDLDSIMNVLVGS